MRTLLNPVYSLAVVLMLGSGHAAEVIILDEDFEGAELAINGPAIPEPVEGEEPVIPAVTTAVVADPQAGGTRGQVLEISLDGTAVWGGLTTTPERTALLPLGISPGVDTYEYTADIYIPSSSELTAPDTTGLRLRWTDADFSAKTEPANQVGVDTLARDEWITMTLAGNIPATFGANGDATTHIQTIYSVYDPADDDAANKANGVVMYIDNIKVVATTSGEDPNLLAATASKFGIVAPGTTETRSYSISNSGLANDLVISSGTLTGANADAFTVDTTFPITIAPGASANVDVTFDTTNELGGYSASLDLATNDVTDPTVSLSLSSIIYTYDPTVEELIINGGFESGSPAGFNSGATLTVHSATDPVRTGNHSLSYALPGGRQWGSYQLNQPSLPSLEGTMNQLAVTPEMIGQPYKFSCWVYRPSVNGIGDEDLFTFIARWNGDDYKDTGPWNSLSGAAIGTDTWVEFIEEGFVPEEAAVRDNLWADPAVAEFTPTTSLRPIFSMRDVDHTLNPDGGQLLFIDDMTLTIELPEIIIPIFPVVTVFAHSNADGSSTITWTSEEGSTYRIEFSADLENWIEIEEEYEAEAASETTSYTDTSSAGLENRYYRVIWNEAPAPEADAGE